MDAGLLPIIMFAGTIIALLLGFPVAMTLGGSALLFAYLGDWLGVFNAGMLNVFPLRIIGIMKNEPLIAVPLFVFMGVMLEKSNIAGDLLHSMGRLFGALGRFRYLSFTSGRVNGGIHWYCWRNRSNHGSNEPSSNAKGWL